MKKIYTKHPIEKRGSILLFVAYILYYQTVSRTPENQTRGYVIFVILLLSVAYAWYEKVIVTETYLEHKKLYLIIPKSQTVIGKQINDVHISTYLPTMSIITVMSANNEHLKLRYFEQASTLKTDILTLAN